MVDSRGYGFGTWKGSVEVGVRTAVDGEKKSRLKLLQEAAIAGQFSHPNVLKLLGVILTKEEVSSFCVESVFM